MKVTKLLTDIIKASEKRDQKGKKSPFMYGVTDESIVIIVDGHYMIFVRKDRFYLDLEKCFPKMTPVDVKKIIFEDPDDALLAYDTGMTRKLEDGRTIKIFESEKATIWIDADNFRYLDLDGVIFKATEKNKPLYVYEESNLGNTLVGFILPVNHN